MSINVGDTVKLIDRFYEHEAFRSDSRRIRKQIASLVGKEFEVKSISTITGRASTGKIDYAIPIELLEKVEEFPKIPKPGDLFKVINKRNSYHHFELGETVEFIKVETSMGMYLLRGYSKSRNEVCNQVLYGSDIEPYTKHRYTAEQIAEAQRIIGEIVAGMAWHQQIAFALIDGNIIALSWKNRYENTKKVFEAKCSPNDEYNEAIGKMICLCRAVGKKLPDWIWR